MDFVGMAFLIFFYGGCRRSFCTNAYLSKMDSLDIMALSGHKTEANFLKYIKVTGKERAKRIAEHKFFQ